MTLPQIEREAGKVKLNRKKIATNSWYDRLSDFMILGLIVLITVVLARNFNRIDENFKILAERSNVKCETEQKFIFGSNWTTNVFNTPVREKVTLKRED